MRPPLRLVSHDEDTQPKVRQRPAPGWMYTRPDSTRGPSDPSPPGGNCNHCRLDLTTDPALANRWVYEGFCDLACVIWYLQALHRDNPEALRREVLLAMAVIESMFREV